MILIPHNDFESLMIQFGSFDSFLWFILSDSVSESFRLIQTGNRNTKVSLFFIDSLKRTGS